MRMVKITHTYLIDVPALSAAQAEHVAHQLLVEQQIDLTDPTAYSVEDQGAGSWDD